LTKRHVAPDSLSEHYDNDPDQEWQRLERHRTEFAVSMRTLQEYMPATPAA